MAKLSRGRFTISANIIMTASLITRTLSFGFVMMSIYIKVGDDILDGDVIKVANLQKVGGMPLGTTMKCIVFSLIGVFAVEMLTGIFGIWGAVGRKKTILAVSVMMSSFLITIYGIYIVILSIIYHQASKLYNTLFPYLTAYRTRNYLSDDYRYTIFPKYLSELGCETYDPPIYQCAHVYKEKLESYLETYFGLITTCIVCQITSIIAAEYTYRKLEFKEKNHSLSENKYYLLLSLKHGILRNFLFSVRDGWKSSKIMFGSICFKILSLITGFGLLGLGLTIVADEFISDGIIKYVFKKLMFYQYYFDDILVGMAASAIVIGTLTVVVSILGLIGSWRKSKAFLLTSSLSSLFLHLPRIIVVVLWVIFIEEINDRFRTEMKKQQDGYFYNNNLNTITPKWNHMLLRLHCCGVYSPYDTYYAYYGHWFCCDNIDEAKISTSTRYSTGHGVLDNFGGCSGIKNDTCGGKILFKTRMFIGWFLSIVLLQIVLEVIGMFFANKEYKMICSSMKSDHGFSNNSRMPFTMRVVLGGIKKFVIRHWNRSKLSLLYFICLGTIFILNFALLVLAVNIRYDKIFGNSDIDDLLDDVSILGVDLSRALKNFSIVVSTFSVVSIVVVIYFTAILIPVKRKNALWFLNLGFLVMLSIASITQIGLWGRYISEIYPTVTDELQRELNSYRYSHVSGVYDWSNSLSWNALFIKGECCGIGNNATDVASSFISSYWYSSGRGPGEVVPTQCCKSQTDVYPYSERYDNPCTYNGNSGLIHSNGCDTVITTRLNAYSIPFFVFTATVLVAEIVCIAITVFEIIAIEKTARVHVKVSEDKIEITEVKRTETLDVKTTRKATKKAKIKRNKNKTKKDQIKADSQSLEKDKGQESKEKEKTKPEKGRTETTLNVKSKVLPINTTTTEELITESFADEIFDAEMSQNDNVENQFQSFDNQIGESVISKEESKADNELWTDL